MISSAIKNKKVTLKAVRDVSILDLLGRQEVNLNRSEISKYIHGRKVLVTGAGGSIGSELVKRRNEGDHFISKIIDSDKIFLKGSEHELATMEI